MKPEAGKKSKATGSEMNRSEWLCRRNTKKSKQKDVFKRRLSKSIDFPLVFKAPSRKSMIFLRF